MALGCNVLLSVREKRKRAPWAAYERAYTIIDLLVGVTFLVIMAAVLLPAVARHNHHSPRLNCTNNLKQIGLSFIQWGLDTEDRFPMQVSVTNGGTMELVGSGAAWVHFMVL